MIRSLCILFLAVMAASASEWMKFPDYRRTVLDNGATILLVENHGAPLISLGMSLRSGSLQDPTGKEGLADITNDLLRKGAGSRSADQISEDLDFIGATLGTSGGYEMTGVRTEFLKKDLATGLEIFSDLILRPKFPEDEVTKLLKQRIDAMKARKDQPQAVISQYYRHFLFGSHPYGRSTSGDEQSLPRLTRDEIVQFHRDNYVSSNMVFVAAGDFSTSEMERMLKEKFGGLPKRDIKRATPTRPEPFSGKRLLLVDKPDATQTFFRIGNIGTSIHDPDRTTIQVINTLFGGRFTSRLNTALRIDSGLSYGANSSFEFLRQPGNFAIGSFTRNASTEEALEVTLKVLAALHDKGFTAEEIASAKAYIKGQFGPTLETTDQIAARLAFFEIYGLDPKVEVDDFAKRLDAVSAADVQRVIAKSFPSTNLVFTLIGKASEIEPVLKKLTPNYKKISITQPGFGGELK